MSRRRNKGGEGKADGNGIWLMSYGDMVTLLMAFFIALLSFASGQTEYEKEALEKFKEGMGLLDIGKMDLGGSSNVAGVLEDAGQFSEDDLHLLLAEGRSDKPALLQSDEMVNQINEYLFRTNLNQNVDTNLRGNGVAIRIQADKVFKRDSR